MTKPAVTNQELMIATTNSGLVEVTTGADDECKLPSMADPKPFWNYGKLSEATEHSSERTCFADGLVIRVGDAVGPLTHPEHPPHIMRGKGGPYRQEARATAGAIFSISRWSKGLGIRYSGPKLSVAPA